jgi:hypothetical protein
MLETIVCLLVMANELLLSYLVYISAMFNLLSVKLLKCRPFTSVSTALCQQNRRVNHHRTLGISSILLMVAFDGLDYRRRFWKGTMKKEDSLLFRFTENAILYLK